MLEEMSAVQQRQLEPSVALGSCCCAPSVLVRLRAAESAEHSCIRGEKMLQEVKTCGFCEPLCCGAAACPHTSAPCCSGDTSLSVSTTSVVLQDTGAGLLHWISTLTPGAVIIVMLCNKYDILYRNIQRVGGGGESEDVRLFVFSVHVCTKGRNSHWFCGLTLVFEFYRIRMLIIINTVFAVNCYQATKQEITVSTSLLMLNPRGVNTVRRLLTRYRQCGVLTVTSTLNNLLN